MPNISSIGFMTITTSLNLLFSLPLAARLLLHLELEDVQVLELEVGAIEGAVHRLEAPLEGSEDHRPYRCPCCQGLPSRCRMRDRPRETLREDGMWSSRDFRDGPPYRTHAGRPGMVRPSV